MQSRTILVLLAAATLWSCEPPMRVTGSARVIDGDSLEIGATSIRLHAIDAPEALQFCGRGGTSWRCGAAATAKLKELVDGHILDCTQRDLDAYGRTVAACTNGSADLGAEMVLAGLALAYRQYGDDYADEEAQAQAARRGIWAGEFTPPWEWRRNPQSDSGLTEPDRPVVNGDCLIKGNINRRGERIYHVPGSSSYDETIIDESRGERWFCSEAEAQSAGWRAPRG
ncbi:MAG TPA: thermonuclease family protein [Gammaproteobacteria bacterium]|jgi:endonuclease YncB( thermonuclease family)